MKSVLILGLILVISFAACSSDIVDEGSGTSPALKKEDGDGLVQVKVFKPDDTVSESGSGDDDEDTGKNKSTKLPITETESSGEGSGVEESTTLPFTLPKEMSTRQPEQSTRTDAKLFTIVSTIKPQTTDEETSSSTTMQNFEEVVTTTSATVTSGNDVGNSPTEDDNDEKENDSQGTFGSRKKLKVKGSSKSKKKSGLSFTEGIIIGVVIGAILAILIILFLVYRLRKKDSGSYALGDPSSGYYKDEPGSPVSGKEYFA